MEKKEKKKKSMEECASILGDMLNKILKQTGPLAIKKTLKLHTKKTTNKNRNYMFANVLSEINYFISFKASITDKF